MTSTSAQPGEEYADTFAEAANHWDLNRLYADLESVKQQQPGRRNRTRLKPLEKACLRGLLCGYSPDDIASQLFRGKEGLRVDLARGLYRYVEMLTGREENEIQNWRDVSKWLEEAGYKQPQITDGPQDWGDSPDVSVGFYGRTDELAKLEQWIVQDRCRVVALLGMTGIGKTALSAKLARQIQGKFEYVIWRSLRNTPAVPALLRDLIQFLSASELPADRLDLVDELISELLGHLLRSRCLLILDNWETILSSGNFAGNYREEYRDYGKLLDRAAQENHQSCLLLTSCEKPKEIARIEGEKLQVRSLLVEGLGQAARSILTDKGLLGERQWDRLINLYCGNPLALRMVSATIQESFNKKVDDFVAQSLTLGVMDINEIIQHQLERVSPIEQQIMWWLTLKRERVSREELQSAISCSALELNEALKSLGWRSLIEKVSGHFALQPAVMQCVSHQLVELACLEISQVSQTQDLEQLKLIQRYPLCGSQALHGQALAKEIPILALKIKEKLLAGSDGRHNRSIAEQIDKILVTLEERSPAEQGYAKINLQNLARIMGNQ